MSQSANPYEPTMSTSGGALAVQDNYEGLAGTAIGLRIIYFSILLMLLCIIGAIASVLVICAVLGTLLLFVMYANLVNNLYKAIKSLQR